MLLQAGRVIAEAEAAPVHMNELGKQALRKGENVIAVVGEKAQHKAFVDVGLVELKPATAK